MVLTRRVRGEEEEEKEEQEKQEKEEQEEEGDIWFSGRLRDRAGDIV